MPERTDNDKQYRLPLHRVKQKRDEALSLVEQHSRQWMANAMAALENLLSEHPDWEFCGEDIRFLITPIVGDPHHHNAWGAFIKRAISSKVIVDTGKIKHMRAFRSNGRRTAIYRRA